MDGPAILLMLRILSALVLLAFLGVLGWLLQRELTVAARVLDNEEADLGFVHVLDGQANATRAKLRPVVSIGRIPTNTIILDNSYTSAQHALITHRDNQWWVEDLNSRNGTLLNDIPVTAPAVITVGDVIAIGDVKLTLEI